MKFPTIYKRTSKGAIQRWEQQLNPENPSQYRTISGQVDGKLVEADWTQCEGTNIGKKNERTPEQQAIFEIEANYKKKLDKDYHKDINNIDKAKIFKPMLASEYSKSKFGFPVYVQPKFDGMRCIATKDGLFTRNGKKIVSCPHIHENLAHYWDEYPDMIFDGELYNHQYKDDFNKIMSLTKKTKPTPKDLAESKKYVQYHVYDLPSVKYNDYSNRLSLLLLTLPNSDIIKKAETTLVDTQQQLDSIYELYMDNGYEGQIIRLPDGMYENKRSKNLIKRKEWIDSEFTLVGFEEGKGNWSGKVKKGIFVLNDTKEYSEENSFKAGVRGTMEYCEQLLRDKDMYIGTKCTVIYCPQLTPDGKPRFGRVKEFNRTDN